MLQLKASPLKFAAAVLFAGLTAQPAMAVLGEIAPAESVVTTSNPAAVRANSLRPSLASSAVTMRQVAQEDGVIVQEYANADGVVFAIVWRGPTFPDMRALLGTYFSAYKKASELPGRARTLGGAAHFEAPGLTVRTSGRMRAFSGWAVASQWVPPGVSIDDLLQ